MPAPVCVVVGYGAGVGHGIAMAFARQGSDLLLVGRSPERHGSQLAELRALGVGLTTAAVDAGDPAALAAVLAAPPGEGTVVLAYNAVVPTPGPPSTLAPDRLAADLQVDVVGALAAVQALLPALRQRGGALLFTGGGMAHHPVAAVASIGIGKAALRALVLMLAQELAPEAPRLGVGLVSIMGQVVPGGPLDPERIGEAFVALQQRLAAASSSSPVDPELLFRG